MSNGRREPSRTRAPRASAPRAHDKILGTVIDLLGTRGYDGVQLREVARRAHVSLARIYDMFGSRDRLIVAAMLRWMDAHAYAALAPPSQLGIYEGLMHVFRAVFEPWERSPRMLEAFHRARTGSAGQALVHQGAAAIGPAIRAVLDGADPAYVRDVELLLANIFYALFGRFADGELAITDLLPILERTAFRLTADNTRVTPRISAARASGHLGLSAVSGGPSAVGEAPRADQDRRCAEHEERGVPESGGAAAARGRGCGGERAGRRASGRRRCGPAG